MPRLPHATLARAQQLHPFLPLLLRACRSLESAQNELRWLSQHVDARAARLGHATGPDGALLRSHHLRELCLDRSRGKPLQYILGTEYFGDLELLVRPGVLIPRPETASAVMYLAERLRSGGTPEHNNRPVSTETRTTRTKTKTTQEKKTLRVLDLCTGTGCIPLLLAHELGDSSTMAVKALGVDVSSVAVGLARRNRQMLMSGGEGGEIACYEGVEFAEADVLSREGSGVTAIGQLLERRRETAWDVVTCNPPYISPAEFKRTTARSVRNYEPRLALVPPTLPPAHAEAESRSQEQDQDDDAGDLFYPHVLRVSELVGASTVVMEVADMAQAERVRTAASSRGVWDEVEIWKDDPWRDQGHGRTVVASRRPGTEEL